MLNLSTVKARNFRTGPALIAPSVRHGYNLYWDTGDSRSTTPMNISVKGEYALAGDLRPGVAAARRTRPNRRHRPAAEDPAEVSGTDSGQPEAGRLRGIAPRRRGRLSAGAARRIASPSARCCASSKGRSRAKRRHAPQSAKRRSPRCGSRSTRRSAALSTTPPSPTAARLERKAEQVRAELGDLICESTTTIRSASAARRWCA